MYSVQIDENGYFTGAYAEISSVVGGIDVSTLPPNMARATCYRFEDESWIYDGNKWDSLQVSTEAANIRTQRIEEFSIIDRYQLTLVYESLAPKQKTELAAYRQAWLEAPETLIIPEKLEWMV